MNDKSRNLASLLLISLILLGLFKLYQEGVWGFQHSSLTREKGEWSFEIKESQPIKNKEQTFPLLIAEFISNSDIENILKSASPHCVHSSYLEKQANSSCHREIITTNHPMKITHSELHINNSTVLVLVQNPFVDFVDHFMQHYQTIVSSSMLAGELFREFSLSKALLWRKFHQYWNKRKEEGENVRFYNVDDLLNEPESFLRFVSGHDNTHAQTRFPRQLSAAINKAVAKRIELEQIAGMMPPTLYGELVRELLPYVCSDVGPRHDQIIHRCNQFDHSRWVHDNSPEKWWLPNTPRKVHLLTTYFKSSTSSRAEEVDRAVKLNYENQIINQVHLWIDGEIQPSELPVNGDRLTIVHSNFQPMYSDLFEYANKYLANHVVIIQNVDLFWDNHDFENIHRIVPGLVFALSRHSDMDEFPETKCEGRHNQNLCLQYKGSHDAFVMIPPIDPEVYQEFTFKQNSWGAENVVIEGLRFGGYSVENPCKEIRAIHSHCSNFRQGTGSHVLPPPEGNRNSPQSKQSRPLSLDVICAAHGC